MVNVEPVGAGASVDDASIVPVEDGSAQGGAYLLGCARLNDAVFADGMVFDLACAVDEVDGVRPGSGPVQDRGALLPA